MSVHEISNTMKHTAKIAKDHELFEPVHPASKPLQVEGIKFIRSSPYHEQPHLLVLSTLSPEYQALLLALQSLIPRDDRYAFDPYKETFNIDEVISLARVYAKTLNAHFDGTSMYVIAFRSILYDKVQQLSSKRQWLADVDKASHQEANESGGLLKYWFGTPDDEHAQNLATCWWVSKQDAVKGGGGKAHRDGMKTVRLWFKHWKVEEYEVVINENDYTFNRIV